MAGQTPTGPFCQSCSMPLTKPEDFGTDERGMRVNDYCHFCYQNGAFMDPDGTMPEMIDRCVRILTETKAMPEAGARAMLTDVIPRLKRWRSLAAASPVPGRDRGLNAGDEIC